MQASFRKLFFTFKYERCFVLSIVLLNIFVIPQHTASTIQLSTLQDTFDNVTCNTLSDCSAYNGSICNNSLSLCKCPDDKPIFVNTTLQGYCLESFNLTGGNCTFDQQCYYSHGACRAKICVCKEEFEEDEGACIKKKNIIIPIAVACVIGISLVSTLFVYFWMSRKEKTKV